MKPLGQPGSIVTQLVSTYPFLLNRPVQVKSVAAAYMSYERK